MGDWFGYVIFGLALLWFLKQIARGYKGDDRPARREYATGVKAPKGRDSPAADDAWEGSFWEAPRNQGVAALIRLKYVDGQGSQTERDVEVRAFDPTSPSSLMIGFCRLRQSVRTFRFDRVMRATDLETGEVIQHLQSWLMERYRASPKGAAEHLLDGHMDMLKVLLYMAKADGRMMAAEVKVIAEFAAKVSGQDGLTPEVVKLALNRLDTPSLHGFKVAFGRVRKATPGLLPGLVTAAQGVVDTQASAHDNEVQALAWLHAQLKA